MRWLDRLMGRALRRYLLSRFAEPGRCAECGRKTLNTNTCAVCGDEPLCPYCIGSRDHDCIRSGEVDG